MACPSPKPTNVTAATKKLSTFLVTFDRGTYDLTECRKPCHWSYFTRIRREDSQDLGVAHQLRGMPGAFRYDGAEHLALSNLGVMKDELEIGGVDNVKLGQINEILNKVRIVKDEASRWNCQNWALEGFEELKRAGLIYSYLDADMVKKWLQDE